MHKSRSLLALLSLLVMMGTAAFAPAFAQDAPTVVLVVRHAEKATDDPTDPTLSEAGVKRAQDLVKAAAEAGVTAVYTTQYKRTKATAHPLATRLNVPLTTVEITRENSSGYAAALAKELLAKHAGRTVLVVGHSNTVPQIVEALGGQRPSAIDEATEYDRLLIVLVPKAGKVKVIHARYGSR